MTNVAAYIRVSTDDPQQNPSRQREDIEKWSLANDEPIAPAYLFEDVGFKRHKSETRPAFQRMLRLCGIEDGRIVGKSKISKIVVAEFDRFGVKDASELGFYLHLLKKAGVRLVDTQGQDYSENAIAPAIIGSLKATTSREHQLAKGQSVVKGKATRHSQGEYQGGHIPYPCDVVCYDPDGKEAWRCVIVGRDKRLQVFPDGRSFTFDGKNNFPPKAKMQVLRLGVNPDRVQATRDIFSWFATEAISPAGIAKRLNKLKVAYHYADQWDANHVTALLKNPVVLGRPLWGKTTQGDWPAPKSCTRRYGVDGWARVMGGESAGEGGGAAGA